jgi:hypothetical protein
VTLSLASGKPSEKPKLGFASASSEAPMSGSLKRYAEGLKTSNSKIEVFHMVLEGSQWDVWAFNFKHLESFYWAWKPQILEKAILAELTFRVFESEGTTMDDMLHNMRAASLREVPCGADVAATFSYKNGTKINREILFCLIQSPSSEENVRAAVKDVFKQFENTQIRQAYALALESTIRSPNMIADVSEKGSLWEKLKNGVSNMVYKRLDSLNQIFLDAKIEEIIRTCYGFTGGEAPSMWGAQVMKLAFGVVKMEEE